MGTQVAATSGDGKTADTLIARGMEALAQQRASATPVDAREAALLLDALADRLVTHGKFDEALQLLRDEVLPVFERLEDARARANSMDTIAEILFQRGDLDEALRICRHELMPIYERLGDQGARAATLGHMADILESRGEFDEALRIRQEEQLPVYTRLGELRASAMTMGKIADILCGRGNLDEAFLILRDEVLPVFKRFSDVRSYAVTLGKIADVLFRRGDVDGARALEDERLELNRRLGDADGIGAALWGLALLDLAEEKMGDAVPRVVEAYEIVLRLGRANAIAIIGKRLGQMLAANAQHDEALVVLRRSADMYRKLGQEERAQEAERLIAELGLG